jgi:hypothetical protein
MKNNKAAGANFIAANLLKNGGPNLADALHAVIQQAWTSETLSWTEGVLCPAYKKGDKLDCKNYRGICLLNVTYKVLLPGITRLGFNQGWVNQQQTKSLLCSKSYKNAMSLTSQRIIYSLTLKQHTTP